MLPVPTDSGHLQILDLAEIRPSISSYFLGGGTLTTIGSNELISNEKGYPSLVAGLVAWNPPEAGNEASLKKLHDNAMCEGKDRSYICICLHSRSWSCLS